VGDAVPAEDDRSKAACDHSEKKGGGDGVFHKGLRPAQHHALCFRIGQLQKGAVTSNGPAPYLERWPLAIMHWSK
jgi:hypothetical protein